MNQPNVTQAVGYWLKRTKGGMFEKGKLNVDWVLDGNKNITVNCVSSNNGAAIVFEKKQFIYLEVYTEVFKREKEKSYYHLFTFLYILLFGSIYKKSYLVLINIHKFSAQIQQLFHYKNKIPKNPIN